MLNNPNPTRTPISALAPPRTFKARVGGAFNAFVSSFFGPLPPVQPNPEIAKEGPRQFPYTPGSNIVWTPRSSEGLTPFSWLISIAELYDTASMCIQARCDEMVSYEWDIVPLRKDSNPSSTMISEARDFLIKPDGVTPWNTWVGIALEEVLVTDALTISRSRTRRGETLALELIDGSSIKPLMDASGRTPYGDGTPAYQQVMYGQVLGEYTTDDMLYAPKNRRTRSMYGKSPTEHLVMTINRALRRQAFDLSYYCYDAETEILTREGWKRFPDLTGQEQVATRSPEGAFEWQQIDRYNDQPFSGDLVRFSNKTVDLMVTPNHRMLVRTKAGENAHPWHIERADSFLWQPHRSRNHEMPAVTSWVGENPEEMVIPDARSVRGRYVRGTNGVVMPMANWMAFLGIYLAEGWTDANRDTITVSQAPHSPHLGGVGEILGATGLHWNYNAKTWKFECYNRSLATYLREHCGHGAENKHMPVAVKDYSPSLLTPMINAMMMGDGTMLDTEHRRYVTASAQLADDLQEVLQKCGRDAWVRTCAPTAEKYEGQLNRKVTYQVCERKAEAHQVPNPLLVPYEGRVYCVSVPNGIVYVRRNGKAIWCGNTDGNVPEAIISLPDIDPDSIEVIQKWFDEILSAPHQRRRVHFIPGQSRLQPYEFKKPILDPVVEEFLDKRVMAMYGVMPQALGYSDDSNRATAGVQENVELRRRLPYLRFISVLMTEELHRNGWVDVRMQFLAEKPEEDRFRQAQIDQIYTNIGKTSVDELRVRDNQEPYPFEVGPYVMTGTGPVPLQAALEGGEKALDAQIKNLESQAESNKAQAQLPERVGNHAQQRNPSHNQGDRAMQDEEKTISTTRSAAATEIRQWERWAERHLGTREPSDFRFEKVPPYLAVDLTLGLSRAVSREEVRGLALGALAELTEVESPELIPG